MPVPAAVARAGVPHGATEIGWLPDCVYTGEKFETGLAFFADAVGRITRFSREPADLSAARRLEGQAALPGLVNAHSRAFHRVLRGRTEPRGRSGDPAAAWREAQDRAAARISDEEVFDAARMVFLEMLLAGVTCVGEFHALHWRADGTPYPEAGYLAREVLRAAREVGVRIALLHVAQTQADPAGGAAAARGGTGTAEEFVRDTEALRGVVEREFPADEAWLGVGAPALTALPLEAFKIISNYAHTHRLRLHARVAVGPAENGRPPVALLAEHGVIDKRFTAVDALELSDDEVRILGTARATACACPLSGYAVGRGAGPVEKLLAAGAGVALGTGGHGRVDLMEEARALEHALRLGGTGCGASGADAAATWFRAATFTGARSLGATGGALEVGRPADFFTVNLYDPAVVGADAGTLLSAIVFGLERRAVREVWVGARQRVANGRHPLHGAIVGRFADAQRRLWAG